MKLLLLSILLCTQVFSANIYLSSKVYQDMPYTDVFKNDGALVMNVEDSSVKTLIPQLENIFKVKLESRPESHITLITPPNFTGEFNPGKIGLNTVYTADDIHKKFHSSIQQTNFKVLCIGSRENDQGNLVFFLVVDAPELFTMRKELQTEYFKKAKEDNKPAYFDYLDFYPHITIGYVKGDVHGVSKGTETCLANHNLIIK